jgi:aldose 1-epimerase
MAGEPPSGRQVELRSGRQRAIVVEVGGGLREYTVDGWQVLDGYPVERMADGGRGQPLLPWPNRIADGRYVFEGRHLQLPIDEVERNNAIHGLTRWLSWHIEEQTPMRVRLGLTLHPQPGYPFTLRLELEYLLDDAGLTVRTTAHNLGDRPLPFGAGQHPYFSVGTPTVDSMLLQLVAHRRLELEAEQRLPTGRLLPVRGTEFDFHERRAVGALVLDECFTDLPRDGNGLARVSVTTAEGERELVLWLDEHFKYVQAFSGDTLAPDRRRQGLALEPMTCPPNAFRTGVDLIVLQPDQQVCLEWGLSPRFDEPLTVV